MSKFILKILWLDNNVAIAIDQVLSNSASPLTSYFFWPRNDAWEQLKVELESKPWIEERDKVILLNKATEIINYWQEEGRKYPLKQVQAKFSDCIFAGTN